MVFLSEVYDQWPWNTVKPKDLTDKEIYTHIVKPAEASHEWSIPVQPCLPGYAYVGIKVHIVGKHDDYSIYPRMVIGKKRFPILGHPWDIYHCYNGKWSTLAYPLVGRTFKRHDTGTVSLLIAHDTACFGKIELLAEKFDDLLEKDDQISYAYFDPLADSVSWIHTPEHFYSAGHLQYNTAPSWPIRTKILYPLQKLFYEKCNFDNTPYQMGL